MSENAAELWIYLYERNRTERNGRDVFDVCAAQGWGWTAYANSAKGRRVCIFTGRPVWGPWMPDIEDAFAAALVNALNRHTQPEGSAE